MNKNEFDVLAGVHGPHCISIYLPITRTDKDRITLKNQLADVQRELENSYQISQHDSASLLQPVASRLSDPAWWRGSGAGLAIFVNDDDVQVISLAHHVEAVTYVADHFYLLPLAPFVHHDTGVYLMTLSADKVKVYYATSDHIELHPVSERMPESVFAVVGHDVKQKSLQFRSGQGEAEGGMYHGHGSGSEEEKKEEYKKFFRAVDKILLEFLEDQKRPLVIACVDYLFPLYQQVSKYPNIHQHLIRGSHEQSKPHELHAEAKKVVDALEADVRKQYDEQFQESLNVKKSSFDPDEIIPGAVSGRIEVLFVKKGNGMWGKYNVETNTVQIDADRRVDNASLINLAAVHTIQNGGRVFTVEEDEMPEPHVTMNAVFRYQAA